jgi:hypothetical protein
MPLAVNDPLIPQMGRHQFPLPSDPPLSDSSDLRRYLLCYLRVDADTDAEAEASPTSHLPPSNPEQWESIRYQNIIPRRCQSL